MDNLEKLEIVINDFVIAPIFGIGLIITVILWGIFIGVLYPLSQITFLIHKLDKKGRRAKEEEYDEELDKTIDSERK